MKRLGITFRRRDLFGFAVAGAATVAASTAVTTPAAARPVNLEDKRKARYQASSPEVRNYYRVNRYPAR
jgi:hypothetical protein